MIEQFNVHFENEIIRVEHIRSTPHPVGSSYLSPDKKYCYVNIPKNSSSSMKSMLHNWSFQDYHDYLAEVEFLVILRDPTQRWISAVSEFLCGENSIANTLAKQTDYSNLLSIPLIKEWIFESVYLDPHCLPQCYYLQGLPMHKIKFFNQDLNGVNQICKYLQLSTPVLKINQSGSSKKVVKNWLTQQLTQQKQLQNIIDVHYWCDHQLLDKATFIS
jgi:hypothetical protein